MNARKVVEPVCLDVLVRWRGDEETGRDQMDEILREVVIITDSEEEEEDSSSDEESSDDDGEVTSSSSSNGSTQSAIRTQQRHIQILDRRQPANGLNQGLRESNDPIPVLSSRTGGLARVQNPKDKKAQRGFKRYQAAWDQALNRNNVPPHQQQSTSISGSQYELRPAPSVPYLRPKVIEPQPVSRRAASAPFLDTSPRAN